MERSSRRLIQQGILTQTMPLYKPHKNYWHVCLIPYKETEVLAAAKMAWGLQLPKPHLDARNRGASILVHLCGPALPCSHPTLSRHVTSSGSAPVLASCLLYLFMVPSLFLIFLLIVFYCGKMRYFYMSGSVALSTFPLL